MATVHSSRERSAKSSPALPRPSSSLIVVNERNEVLMVQRNPDSRSFAGAHVFPGGNFDKEQDPSFKMTAIRETFEETGILLASRSGSSSRSSRPLTETMLEDARKAIHAQKLLFTDFLSAHGLEPDVSSLLPFTEWITPPPVPRRFHARFFITFLPLASALAGPTSGAHYQRLPTPDSNSSSESSEVLSAKYMHPRTVLTAFSIKELALMPPQFYLLSTLLDIFSRCGNENVSTPAQREKIIQLTRGAFGRMVINPRGLAPGPDVPEGRQVLTYEGDETRGGKKGTLHRVVLVPGKGGVPSGMTLLRNFDVFTEIEEHAFGIASKL